MGGGQVSEDQTVTILSDVLKEDDERIDDNYTLPTYKLKASLLTVRHEEGNYYSGWNICKKKPNVEERNLLYSNCNKELSIPSYYFTVSLRIKGSSI